MKNPWQTLLAVALQVTLVSLATVVVRAADLASASADEPRVATASLKRAAEYLDEAAVDWTRTRRCGTCHTNYAYLLARPAIEEIGSRDAMREVRVFFEERVEHGDDPETSAHPRWDTEVIATAATLAIHDARTTGGLHPLTRKALDRMWTDQRDDGGFNWLKCGWPPYEHDDYYGVVFAALGVGLAPDGYASTPEAGRGVERLRVYLRAHPAPDLHHRTFLLWASLRLDGLMSPDERARALADLRSLQHKDGGWSLPSLGEWDRRDKTPNPKDAPRPRATDTRPAWWCTC